MPGFDNNTRHDAIATDGMKEDIPVLGAGHEDGVRRTVSESNPELRLRLAVHIAGLRSTDFVLDNK